MPSCLCYLNALGSVNLGFVKIKEKNVMNKSHSEADNAKGALERTSIAIQ